MAELKFQEFLNSAALNGKQEDLKNWIDQQVHMKDDANQLTALHKASIAGHLTSVKYFTPKFFIKLHRSKNNHENWNPFQEKITYLHPMILKFNVLNKYKSTYRESIWSGVEIENIHSLSLL